MKKPSRLLDTLAVAFLAIVWGLAWPVAKIGLRDCDPFLLASLRSIVGGIFLYVWRLRKTDKEQLDRHTLWVAFIAGTCWVGIPMALVSWALLYINVGLGSILQSTTPFFVAICAYFLLGEKQFSFAKIAGLVLGFLGIVLLFSDKPITDFTSVTILAGFAILIPSILNGYGQVYARKHFHGKDQFGFMTVILIIAGLESLPFSFLNGMPKVTPTIDLALAILYLGIVASAIPFAVYFALLVRVDIVILSMVGYVIPVVAVISGIVMFGERMSPPEIAGSIMVLVGVVLATQYDLVKSKILSRHIS
ncbi:MAG: EamA family transporter [Ignavibacteriales bacterium]|nr:EamA family transporter [Ignavibacteriales bacterium]